MTATIVVSPNPVVRPATANAYIGGLTPGTRYNFRVDATTIATARATREGTLAVGISVGATSRLGGHAVDVRDSANRVTLAAGTFMVAAAPTPPPPPPPPPPPITEIPKVVTVSSVAAFKGYLADDSVDEIDWTANTYKVSPASAQAPDSLWIGSAFAGRKRPVIVDSSAATFDGLGALGSTGIIFAEGCHDMEWRGFRPVNMRPRSTGIMVIGGWPDKFPPHDLKIIRPSFDATNQRQSATSNQEHAIYFAAAKGDGPHDILVEDAFVDGSPLLGLWAGIHMDHGDDVAPASHHITVRRLKVRGTNYPIILWTPYTHDWLFDGADIQGAREFAARIESEGGTGIVLKDVVSSGSGQGGFYTMRPGYSVSNPPPGVTIVGGSLQ